MIWLYGYGWPIYRGGPMFYADQVGLKHIADRLSFYAKETNDPSLEPAPLLKRLAAEGKTFASLATKRRKRLDVRKRDGFALSAPSPLRGRVGVGGATGSVLGDPRPRPNPRKGEGSAYHCARLKVCELQMTHPGEQFYPEGVHWNDPIARGTLPGLLSKAAADYGERPALEFRDRPISYTELDAMAATAASAFLRAGYGKDKSIALFLGNTPIIPSIFSAR